MLKGKIKDYFSDIWKDKNKRITLYIMIFAPFLCAFVVDCFNRRSVFDSLKGTIESPFVFFINSMIIMFSMSIGLLLKRRLAYLSTAIVFWVAMGVVNYVIMSMRVSPFSATDLKLIGNIDNIIEQYLSPLSLILIIVAIAFVVACVSVVWVKLPKYAEKINYIRNIIFVVISFIITWGSVQIGLSTGSLSEKFPNMTVAYCDYGFPYCFASSVFNTGVSQPEEYSKSTVMDIVNKLESAETVEHDNVVTPNIIFLQMESFFDVSNVKGLELSAEATPVFNKLKEEYPSGYLTVNNIGYGTANTEFEVMTGLNLDDFGPGEFPYNTILSKTTCESTAYILKEYGYATHALHNNTATFYSRNNVFKRLGFDTFTSLEYMYPEEYTVTEWAKDKILADEIIKVLDSTDDTDYIYTISVQGHGAYPTEPVLENPPIEVVNVADENDLYLYEYYVNTISEMDAFIGSLIERLSTYNEETVLVIYGDHLPGLDITEDELINGDLYKTEYVVWNNIGLEMEDKDLETFQLSSRILEHLNMDHGYINKFHQTFAGEDDYYEKLHLLSYDILYGNMFAYKGINPYIATDMKMGTLEVYVTEVINATYGDLYDNIPDWEENGQEILMSIIESSDNEEEDTETATSNEEETTEDDAIVFPEATEEATGWYIVKGENFTECSHVYVNGEEYNTYYIDAGSLLVNVPELASLDMFVIKQQAGTVALSSSHEFTYFYVNEEEVQTEEEETVE